MKRRLPILFFLIIIFNQCQHGPSVQLTNQIDPDIILVNIEEGDRASIANILLMIDSYEPLLIGVDAWFIDEKDPVQDSVLVGAFTKIPNDFLAFSLGPSEQLWKSHRKFSSVVIDEGLMVTDRVNGLLSHVTPIKTIGNKVHEQFPLKIIKHWKPGFEASIRKDQSIPIKFTRTLEEFRHINGSDMSLVDPELMKDKIVLLGFLGPGNEDKHYTPIRWAKEYPNDEPDTYGLVIIANTIRTILDYQK